MTSYGCKIHIFLKEDVSIFKMRGQAFSYDNPSVAICIICTTGLNFKVVESVERIFSILFGYDDYIIKQGR